MTLNAALAADHIAKRDAAIAAARKNENDTAALAAVAEHDAAVRGLVGDAVKSDERADYVNAVVAAGAAHLPDDVARRSFDDVRILGMRVGRTETFSFVERSADALDALDTDNWKPAPVMLAEAPNGSQLLARVQTFTHNSTRGYVPVVPQIQATITGRNDELQPAGLETGAIGTFETVKVAAMVKADHDDVQDYQQLEASLDAALLSALGAGVDDVIVNGGTDGDITVPGLMGLGIVTPASVSVASVLSALARVKTARAVPDTILMHPDTEAAFLGAIDGALLGKLPEIIAIPSVPADTAIVAALGNTAVAMRENLGVASATDHPDLFYKDQVAFAGRARIGDVVVANAAHVQIVKTAA
ncbi:phage major capsid protein [Streptomyces atratus]|uniref:phage major capsid family protein n=1 Tax=Streptomyces atratus TaxID=1893 RepID=UPI00324303BA